MRRGEERLGPPNAVGCGLGLVLGSPGLILLSAVADGAGNAILQLPLTGPSLPLGTGPLHLQNLTFCPSDPVLGFVFSPMHTIFVGSA